MGATGEEGGTGILSGRVRVQADHHAVCFPGPILQLLVVGGKRAVQSGWRTWSPVWVLFFGQERGGGQGATRC